MSEHIYSTQQAEKFIEALCDESGQNFDMLFEMQEDELSKDEYDEMPHKAEMMMEEDTRAFIANCKQVLMDNINRLILIH